MKMVKSLLLGSVAGIAAITGANAADLPLAEPVEYVRICDTWGKGYFYIPGTQTCLQISGLVRSDVRYLEQFTRAGDSVFFRNRARLNFDARTQTELGTLRSYIRLQGDWSNNNTQNSSPFGGGGNTSGLYVENAFIQFAGVTAGLAQSFFDRTYSGSYVHLFTSDQRNNLLGYTATFGSGFSASIAIEDRSKREVNGGSAGGLLGVSNIVYAGTSMPDVVANIAVNQAWGSFQLSGAVTQLRDNTTVGGLWVGTDTDYGFAIQASGAVNLPFLSKGTRLWATAAYADGALGYLGSVASPLGGLGLGQTNAYVVPLGGGNFDLKTSSGWAISGGGSFWFTPTLRSHITVGYVDIDSPFLNAGGIATADYGQVTAAANIVYSPVANLDLGLEVFYQAITHDKFVGVIPATTDDDRFGAIARIERRF